MDLGVVRSLGEVKRRLILDYLKTNGEQLVDNEFRNACAEPEPDLFRVLRRLTELTVVSDSKDNVVATAIMSSAPAAQDLVHAPILLADIMTIIG